jgi:spermidine synthase
LKPTRTLAETTTPEGARLSLHEHDGAYTMRLSGQALMDSTATASELLLGELALGGRAGGACRRVLIGGLGLGFTLKRVLELTPAGSAAEVEVVELLPAVVEWNRVYLRGLNGSLLDDPRVQVVVGDVWQTLAHAIPGSYDAVTLDVDNGPAAMVRKENARLYDRRGLELIATALEPGGRAVFWSARPDDAFRERLSRAGFRVEAVRAKRHAHAKQNSYVIYVADKVTAQSTSRS